MISLDSENTIPRHDATLRIMTGSSLGYVVIRDGAFSQIIQSSTSITDTGFTANIGYNFHGTQIYIAFLELG